MVQQNKPPSSSTFNDQAPPSRLGLAIAGALTLAAMAPWMPALRYDFSGGFFMDDAMIKMLGTNGLVIAKTYQKVEFLFPSMAEALYSSGCVLSVHGFHIII